MKKFISKTLIISILLNIMLTMNVAAAQFIDMPDNWAKEPMENAISNGLLKGDNGKINPQGNLTRAQLVTILNRALGISEKGDISRFVDMDSSKWYYEEFAKAVNAGLIQGSGENLNPDKDISRQEAFVIVARALEISGNTNDVENFDDGNKVSEWAEKAINGLIKNGYLKGNDGKINPLGNITRAEYASLMNEIIGGYIVEPGTYDTVIKGNILIKSPNVELANLKVDGDLIIAEGVLTDKTVLSGVEVSGRILIRGGGELVLENNSRVNDIVVSNKIAKSNISVDKTSQVAHLELKTRANVDGEGVVKSAYVDSGADGSKIATKDTKIDTSKDSVEVATGSKKEDKKEEKKESSRSSGGGGRGSSSSSGSSGSNNDKEEETPVTPGGEDPKPNKDKDAEIKKDIENGLDIIEELIDINSSIDNLGGNK